MRGRIETETRIRNTISFVWKIFTSILWSRMENSKYHLFRTKYIYIDCDPQNSRLRLEDSNFHIRLRILSSRVREEKILIFKYVTITNFIEKILKIRKTDSNFQIRIYILTILLLASHLESRLKQGFEIQLVSYEKYLHRSSDREWRIPSIICFVRKIFT